MYRNMAYIYIYWIFKKILTLILATGDPGSSLNSKSVSRFLFTLYLARSRVDSGDRVYTKPNAMFSL